MNTLNNRIAFEISYLPITSHTAGMHTYILRRVNKGLITTNIFTGNFYYNGIDSAITLDVTDIIASDGFVIKEDDLMNQSGTTIINRLANEYNFRINWSDGGYNLVAGKWVAKVYDYNNKVLDSGYVWFMPSSYPTRIRVCLQGFLDDTTTLVPHYPIHGNFPFALSVLCGDNISSIPLIYSVDDYTTASTISLSSLNSSSNTFTYISNVNSITNNGNVPVSDGNLWIASGSPAIKVKAGNDTWIYVRYPEADSNTFDDNYPCAYAYIDGSVNLDIDDVDFGNIDTSDLLFTSKAIPTIGEYAYETAEGRYEIIDTGFSGNYGYKVATFDACPKRYYLMWQDRYGSFQCQAFNNYSNYSETFERAEVQDYQNRRRNATINIQSKWQLNSGWISEQLYPFYESIYTSPILLLYDTEENKTHSVLISGDYQEKTYRNQKKMINMELELQENKTQNMIY